MSIPTLCLSMIQKAGIIKRLLHLKKQKIVEYILRNPLDQLRNTQHIVIQI